MRSGATGKPTKDVVKAEIITMLKEAGNTFAEGVLNDRTDCGVDGSQDKLSAETLPELADGNVGITPRNRSASRPGTEMGTSRPWAACERVGRKSAGNEGPPPGAAFAMTVPGCFGGSRRLPLLMAGTGTTLPETNLLPDGAVSAPGEETTA